MKRSKEEIQKLKDERAQRRAEREERKREREEYKKEKAVQKEQRLKALKEREERRKIRAQKKEAANDPNRVDITRKRKKGMSEEDLAWERLPIYRGEVKVGERFVVKFGGTLERGTLESISSEDDVKEGEEMLPSSRITFYNILGDDGYHYPCRREDLVEKLN